MEVNEEYRTLQDKWRKKLLFSYYAIIAMLFVIEIVVYLMMRKLDYAIVCGTEEYILTFILLPSLINLISVLVVRAVLYSRAQDKTKNLTLIVGTLITCFVVASVHGFFLVTACIFVLPIVVSLTFDDLKLTRVTTILAIVLLLLSLFTAEIFDTVWSFKDRMANGIAGMAFTMFFYVVCSAIVDFGTEKNKILVRNIQVNQEMSRALKIDSMTGLYNHTEFYNRLEQYYREYNGVEKKLTISVLDVDHFKKINDTYGHERGDAVLIQIAQTLKEKCSSQGHIFRYGGEEFAVICRHINGAQMEELMKQVTKSVNELHFDSMPGETIGISCGVYEYRGDRIKPEDIFSKADSAMYRAKEQGRNRCVCFKEGDDELSVQKRSSSR
ncbi:MAG: GGDEF domain-containing protein [Acetatifactor sp.]